MAGSKQACRSRQQSDTRQADADDSSENEILNAVQVHEHPRFGPCTLAAPAVLFDKTPQSIRRLAPLPGEHTLELLKEFFVV